jgi:GH24 family phage-related lysozyme (muramidase)
MARIGAGTATPNRPSIDGPGADAAGGAEETSGSAGSATTRVAGDGGPDRPTPQAGAGSRRAMGDPRAFVGDIRGWEGEHPFMYVDTRGHVTTGIGHLLENAEAALKLPWHDRATGQPATPAQVRSAFDRMREIWSAYKASHPKGKGIAATNFADKSDLALPRGVPTKLATDRLREEFLPKLQRLFPGWGGYPMPAQRALVDMAYNLGVGKLEDKFPRLLEACWRGDFATAAKECDRSSSRQERNEATRSLFLEAASLNAVVRGLPKEVRS